MEWYSFDPVACEFLCFSWWRFCGIVLNNTDLNDKIPHLDISTALFHVPTLGSDVWWFFAAIFSGALTSLRHGRRSRLARCGDSRELGDRLGPLGDGQGHAASHVGTVVERRALGHRGVGAHAQDGAGRLEMSGNRMEMSQKTWVVKRGRTLTFRIFGNLHMFHIHHIQQP